MKKLTTRMGTAYVRCSGWKKNILNTRKVRLDSCPFWVWLALMIWGSVSHPGKLFISGLGKRIKTRKCLMEYITVDLKNLNRNKRMFIWWNGAEAGLRQSRVEYWVYSTFLIFIKSSHWIVIKWKTVIVSRASSYHVWPRLFLARKSSSTTFKKFLPFK